MAVDATRPRRELVLAAAADLFAERGFRAVGVDEIGAAAGITGPGVYRHFARKEALLVALFDALGQRMLAGVREISAASGPARDTLERLVDFHLDLLSREGRVVGVYLQEERDLPPADRRRFRRGQRSYAESWRVVLSELREDLTSAQVTAGVQGGLAVLNSPLLGRPPATIESLRPLLRQMCLAALLTRRTPR